MARELASNQERLVEQERLRKELELCRRIQTELLPKKPLSYPFAEVQRSEEHTSELQSRLHLVCRLLLEKKKKKHVHTNDRAYRTKKVGNDNGGCSVEQSP